jgi:3-isopropylmalate dehydrogenase
MTRPSAFEIAVLPGDGIGVEVTAAALEALEALAAEMGGLRFAWRHYPGGAGAYRDTGVALSDETMKALEQADAILFGAMGLPDIRYPDGTEIAPQLDIRVSLDLYAGVRPIRTIAGLPSPLSDPRAAGIDFVLIREQTEGLFYARGRGQVSGDQEARDTMRITRQGSERVFNFALRLAERRKERGRPGRVTCVDKSNVLTSMAFFRRIFDEQARRYPAVAADHCYIDAMALNLVRQPWAYDVIVTENMFGDILSDLGAGLVGGMGMAPSGDVGDRHALFQPAHGSAPDIAGTGTANPTAMFLSAVMMLEWLAERHGLPGCGEAADKLRSAVERPFQQGRVKPFEFGGVSGTAEITQAVVDALRVNARER